MRFSLFPIQSHEWRKFLPMALMMFFILFVYTILRTTKDSLVMSAVGSGAEIVPFIKTYCITPISIAYILAYMWLSNSMTQRRLFYITLGSFTGFFFLYGLFIYPNFHIFHLNPETLGRLQLAYPHLKWFIAIVGNWSFTIFYIFAELWGAIILNLMFWQFANSIISTEEAKRFYSLFGFIANFGLIAAGQTVSYFSSAQNQVIDMHYHPSIQILLMFISGTACIIAFLYYWMSSTHEIEIVSNPHVPHQEKISFLNQLVYVTRSKHLQYLFLMVVAYGIAMNFCNGIFLSCVFNTFKTTGYINAFLGKSVTIIGVVTILLMLIGGNILRFFSWRTGALLTPIVMLISSSVFLSVYMYADWKPNMQLLGSSIGIIAVWFGVMHNVLTRSTKYAFFDPTKEMVYIPLSRELRTKGKACIDVASSRFAKGVSGVVQSFFFVITGLSFVEITPILGIILILLIVIWIIAVNRLAYLQTQNDH